MTSEKLTHAHQVDPLHIELVDNLMHLSSDKIMKI